MRTAVVLVLELSLVVIYNVHCNENNGTIHDVMNDMGEKEDLMKQVRQLERDNNLMKEQLNHVQKSLREAQNERDDYKEVLENRTWPLEGGNNLTKEQLDVQKSPEYVQNERDHSIEGPEKAKSHSRELKCVIYPEAADPERFSDNFIKSALRLHLEQTISNLSTELSAVRQEQTLTTSRLSSLEERIVQLEKGKKTVVFPNCEVNGDCDSLNNSHCNNGICRCEIGFGMDGTTCRRLTECITFSEMIRVYEGRAIWGYDKAVAVNQSPESCQQLCIHNPKCKTVDFQVYTHKCFLSDKTWFDVPVGNRGSSADYNSYQKDCDRWMPAKNNVVFPNCEFNVDCAFLTNAHCNKGLCRCDIGFAVDGTTCRSLTECITFSEMIRNYEGHAIWGYNIGAAEGQSPESCQRLCIDNPKCKTVDFHIYTHKCSPSDKTWFEVPVGSRGTSSIYHSYQRDCDRWKSSKNNVVFPNWEMNRDCVSLNNAHCSEGICRCDIGFAMDGTTCRSLTECITFSEMIRNYEGHAIWGYNIGAAEGQSPESCQRLCIDNPKCKTVDFHIYTHKCSPSDKTWFEVPVGSRGTSSEYHSYQRDCDRWKSTKNNVVFPNCEVNGDCVSLNNAHCNNGICRCDIGFAMDGTTCRSLTECITFSEMIRNYEGHAIWGYNIGAAEGQSPESCQRLCIDNPKCKTVDFHIYTHKCSPSDKTWFEVPVGSRGTSSEYYSYQRDCDRWKSAKNTVVFPNCEMNVDCASLTNAHCNKGICRCDIGFAVDETTCRSLTECITFSTMIKGYEGRAIGGYNIRTVEGQSPESCQQLCIDNPKCKTVDFNIHTHKCFPSDKTWFEVPAGSRAISYDYYSYQRDCDRWKSAKNNVVFPNCEVNGDCVSLTNAHCNNGICRCDIGFAMDGTTCRTLTECITFSKMIKGYEGRAIGGYNIRTVEGQSPESCQQLCIDNPKCKTVDFNIHTHKCFPSHKTWFEVPVGRRAISADFYSYQRDCDRWKSTVNNDAFPICMVDGDCRTLTNAHCNKGICRCDIGFAIDQTACRRLTECITFSKMIKGYERRAIGGHNIAITEGQSPESCQQLCIDNPECKTVDFNIYTHKCFLSDKTWFEVPVRSRGTLYDFISYQRDCDW